MLQAIPDQEAGTATVPHLSVALTVVVAIAVATVTVLVIYSGARQSQIGRLVRRLTDETVDYIRRAHPERGESAQDPVSNEPEEPPAGAGREVHAADSGWVQRVDEHALLTGLPENATAQLDVRAGVFVVQGITLARVWGGNHADEHVRAAIRLGNPPTMDQDLAYGIRQLVDIAERSLSAGVGDSTTTYEVIVHLGQVLRELLLRDLPATTVDGPDGQRLLRAREHSLFDYVDLAVVRIRLASGGLPDTAIALLDTMGMLARELDDAGLADRGDYLREHAQSVLNDTEGRDLLDWDKQRTRREAAANGFLPHGQS